MKKLMKNFLSDPGIRPLAVLTPQIRPRPGPSRPITESPRTVRSCPALDEDQPYNF